MVLLLLCTSLARGAGEPVTVEVEGYATLAGGNRDAARRAALNNAFRLAVEQVVGVMVESRTAIRDAVLMNDRIFSRSSGFIKSYRITGESFEPDACRIRITATVSTVRLEKSLDDVGLLSRKLGKPRIALIITEQNITSDASASAPADESVGAGIAESVVHDLFVRKGYNLVDRDTIVTLARRDGALSSAGSIRGVDAAMQVAAAGGAEVVIVGQAVAKAGAAPISGTSMRTSVATVSLRVVDTDTGHLVASHSATARAANVNPAAGGAEAIQKASQEVAESLNRQIIATWNRNVTGTRTVRLEIRGLEFSHVSSLCDRLKERLSHVEETFERGYRDGTLSLDAEITGTTRELAEELTTSDLGGYRFKVLSLTGNTVRLHLLKR
jgi:hypothetical protein